MKGNKKNEVMGCLPEFSTACIILAIVVCLISNIVSCIRPLENKEEEKPVPEEDSTKGMAALSFFLDKASYDSCLVISESVDTSSAGTLAQNAYANPLDSNLYRLTISTAGGVTVYDSTYAGRPDVFYVKAGTYKIRVTSRDFKEPDIYPLFGQEQSVKAKKDSTLCVEIVSRQLTGGIRFSFTHGFTSWFKGTGIYLKRDTVSVKYGYGTRHYLYFYPGELTVIYKNKDGYPSYTPPDKPGYADTVLFKRKLKANELVTIALDYDLTKVSRDGFTFSSDTFRIRKDEYFNLGGIAPYGCNSVWYAQTHVGDTINLFGYIVGGDVSSTTFKKEKPFTSKTNIVIGAQEWQALREKTIGVELPNGDIRKKLNLVDHPENLKKPIVIHGVVSDSYFGYPGLKNVTSYQLLK
ncbi:MAG: DUF4493 domain-containing protein [Bacteroidales bacterium]|nr:DUF4493 domain-containing protein [Bacteroidales bacterium]